MRIGKSLFTIIELLIVIAIIAILSGILLAALSAVNKKKDEVATKKMIMDLTMGVSKYYEANGEYPDQPDKTNYGSKVLKDALVTPGFVTLDKDYFDPADSTKIVDRWGQELLYYPMDAYQSANTMIKSRQPKAYNGKYMNPTSFQINSLGAEGTGGEKMLGNY